MCDGVAESANAGSVTRESRAAARTVSQDVADIIWRLRKVKKLSLRKIAAEIGKPLGAVYRVLHRCDPVTGIQKVVSPGRPTKITEDVNLAIREMALADPYIGLEGLTALYNEIAEKKLSYETIRRRLDRMGLRLVDIPADAEEVRDKRRFPKSQFVRKFEDIPQKADKQRISRRKPVHGKDQESADLPVEPKKRRSRAKINRPFNLELDHNLGYHETEASQEGEGCVVFGPKMKRRFRTKSGVAELVQTPDLADIVSNPESPSILDEAPIYSVAESMDMAPIPVTTAGGCTPGTTRKKRSRLISQDAVDIILRLRKVNKLSLQQISDRTGKTKSVIYKILRQCDPVTGIQRVVSPGRPRKSTAENDEIIRDIALANPYVGLEGLTALYNETAEIKLSYETIRRRLDRTGLRTVDISADVEEVSDHKRFPKSHFVRKFVDASVKAAEQRTRRRKPVNREHPDASDLTDKRWKRKSRAKIKLPVSADHSDDLPLVEEEILAIMVTPIGRDPLPLLPES